MVAVVYGVLQLQLPHHSFWSNDAGEKLVQVRSLIENGVSNPALPYDRLGLEPKGSFEFAPFYPGHARIVDKKLMPVVPLYFPLLSSLFFRIWGHGGLYVIPLLATLLTLALLVFLARERYDPGVMPLVLTGTGLASPVFFYSLLFFEHTLAACLATAGFVLIELGSDRTEGRKRLYGVMAGLATGLGIWVRGDVYFIVAGLLAALLVVRRYRSLVVPFLVGCMLALLPFYLVNVLVYGSALGPQVASMLGSVDSGSGGSSGFSLLRFAAKRWDIFQYYILAYTNNAVLNYLFLFTAVIPGLFLGLGGEKLPRRNLVITVWTTFLVLATCITFGRLFFLADPMSSTLGILGLFGSMPFLPFALAAIRDKETKEKRGPGPFLPVFVGVALLAYILGLPSRGGLQWGPRYLLSLYPALALLAIHGGVKLWKGMAGSSLQKVFAVLFGLLLLAGVSIQGFGVRLLYDKKKATATNMAVITALKPAVLVTDTWWVPEDNADLYLEIPMYSFYTLEKMNALFQKLAAGNNRDILFVSARDYRDFIAKQPELKLISFMMTDHGRLHLFNLYIHQLRLGG
jgi:hypothetical protein